MVKLALAGACLAGVLVSLLVIVQEPSDMGPGDGDGWSDESPFRPSRGGRMDDGSVWFTASSTGRR